MSFKIKYTIKHNFRLKLEKNLKHTEIQPNLPVCLQKKECTWIYCLTTSGLITLFSCETAIVNVTPLLTELMCKELFKKGEEFNQIFIS